MIKIKLSPNIRFSQNIARGAIPARIKLTEEINDKVFQRMLMLYGKKTSCGIGAIKSSYNSLLPERKDINIIPLPVKEYDETSGYVRIEEKRNIISGYAIEIPTNKKKKLNILDLSSFMHESTHLLDYLLNPKYIANHRKMCEKNIYDKCYFDIYDKYFYNTEDMRENSKKKMLIRAEEETRKELKHVPCSEKMIFLNFIKYGMEMEYHAYKQDIFYAKLLKKLGRPVDKESLEDYNTYMAFPEKIEIVNRLIREEIEKVRK